MSIITITTDFGRQDYFAGVMKGVIRRINPLVQIVDLTHDIPPQGIAQAAFVLYSTFRYFEDKAIHLVVVDPGVGSERDILAVEAHGQTFIGPDNGIFSYILDEAETFEARYVRNKELYLPHVSLTFHGRDIMAPTAAYLSTGFKFLEVGPLARNPVRLAPLKPEIEGDSIKGRVIYVDHFGNLITNIPSKELEGFQADIKAGPVTIQGLSRSYDSVDPGTYLAISGSSGFIEIAKSMGRAESPPDLGYDTEVVVKRNKN